MLLAHLAPLGRRRRLGLRRRPKYSGVGLGAHRDGECAALRLRRKVVEGKRRARRKAVEGKRRARRKAVEGLRGGASLAFDDASRWSSTASTTEAAATRSSRT